MPRRTVVTRSELPLRSRLDLAAAAGRAHNGTIHFHYKTLRAEYALQRPHSPTHTHAMQPNVLSAGSLTSAHLFRCALPCGQVLSAVHLRDDGLLAQRVVLVRSEGSHLMETSLVESDESEKAAHSV